MNEHDTDVDSHPMMTDKEKETKGYDVKSFVSRMNLRLKKVRDFKTETTLFAKPIENCRSALS